MPKDPINAFYKQTLKVLKKKRLTQSWQNIRILKAYMNSCLRRLDSEALEGICPDIMILCMTVCHHISPHWSRVGRIYIYVLHKTKTTSTIL